MKTFVRDELEADNDFHFRSGRRCSRPNLGQIVKIAFELRTITQKALDDMDSDEDEDMNQESIEKRSQMQGWFHFCNNNVAAIEKVWNQKLDKSEQPEDSNSMKADEPSLTDDHEQTIEDMLAKLKNSGFKGRGASVPVQSKADAALLADIAKGRQDGAKDDFSVEPTTNEYGDNQFWKQPDMYDIDDLLAEMDDDQ